MKLNFPVIFSLTCAIAASASAESKDATMYQHNANDDYKFVTLKGGIVTPAPLNGNTGLDVGNDAFTLGLSVGRKFEDRYALEFEYMYRGKSNAQAYASSANVTTAGSNAYWQTSSNSFMINAMVDLVKCDMITPYAKIGAGISANKADNYVFTDYTSSGTQTVYPGTTNNAFAWQVGAGLNMKTTDMFDTQLQYMYVDRGTVQTKAIYGNPSGSARTGQMKDHVVTIGLTVRF